MFNDYAKSLSNFIDHFDWDILVPFAESVKKCWAEEQQFFLCGNGGSAGNAIHLANDYSYGCGKNAKKAMKVQSLSANPATITCLANDEDYSQVYSLQLKSYGKAGDILLVLSGSGNSPNILEVLKQAKNDGITTIGILGFDGGKALDMLDIPIHFPINDMQMAEDLQLVVGHMVMKWLSVNVPEIHAK